MVRLLASFLFLAVLFGGVVGWGLHRSRRALDDVRLLDAGYLRLALSAAELRAAQSLLLAFLERLLDERDPGATRSWIEAARRMRPERIDRLRELAGRVVALSPADHRPEAGRLARRIDELARDTRAGEETLDRLLAAIDAHRADEAERIREEALRRERSVDQILRGVGRSADRMVADITGTLERNESRTFWMLLGLALVSLGIAAGILVFVHAALAPLGILERAVRAVARGDLGRRAGIARNDEIGRLAAQFDRMTEAIRERDERLLAARQSEKLAALGRMAAHVSHEVRNPLSAIGLNAELLEEEVRRLDDPATALALVGAVTREVERLTRVTESYLRLARIPHPEKSPADPAVLVRETVAFGRAEAEAGGVTVEVEAPDAIPPIAIDADQIRQVIGNLLRNALEAVAGRDERCVRIAVRDASDAVEIVVEDTGPGIPEPARQRLFEPFFTTKPKGTGIGLAGSRQIALGHQGTLTLDPGPSAGARFRLRLPRLPAAPPPDNDPPSEAGTDPDGV